MSELKKGSPTGKLNDRGTMMEVRMYVDQDGRKIDAGTRWIPVTQEMRQKILGQNNPVVSLGATVTEDMAERLYADELGQPQVAFTTKAQSDAKIEDAIKPSTPDWREVVAVKPGSLLPQGVKLIPPQNGVLPDTKPQHIEVKVHIAPQGVSFDEAVAEVKAQITTPFPIGSEADAEIKTSMLEITAEEDEEWGRRAQEIVQRGIDAQASEIEKLAKQQRASEASKGLVSPPSLRQWLKASGLNAEQLFAELMIDERKEIHGDPQVKVIKTQAEALAEFGVPADYLDCGTEFSVLAAAAANGISIDSSGAHTGNIVAGSGLQMEPAISIDMDYVASELGKRQGPEDRRTPEHSGFNVNYYSVPIDHPKRPERAPYVFEVEDLIQALNLSFHEGTVLKSLVRQATERELGLAKQGGDAIRDAEKMIHSSKEHHRALIIKRDKQKEKK
jgi:hypothetical protein